MLLISAPPIFEWMKKGTDFLGRNQCLAPCIYEVAPFSITRSNPLNYRDFSSFRKGHYLCFDKSLIDFGLYFYCLFVRKRPIRDSSNTRGTKNHWNDILIIELYFYGVFMGENPRKSLMSCGFHRRTSFSGCNYGGGDGNWTRVRKPIHTSISECSLSFKIPSASRR